MMNANEYLHFLEEVSSETEEQFSNRINNIREYGKHREKQTGKKGIEDAYIKILAGESIGKVQIPKNFKDFPSYFIKEFLYKPIIKAAPEDIKQVIINIPLAVLHIGSYNAQIIKSPNGEPLIIINAGLLSLSQFFFESWIAASLLETELGMEAATGCIIDSYRFIIENISQNGTLKYPIISEKIPFELLYGSQLGAFAIEAFTICHEIGHFYLDHLSKAETKRGNLTNGTQTIANPEFYQISVKHEIEADIFGWDLLNIVWKKLEIFSKLDVDSTTLSLNLFVLLTLFERNIKSASMYNTHPPALFRLTTIQKYNKYKNYPEKIIESVDKIIESAQSVPYPNDFIEYYINKVK